MRISDLERDNMEVESYFDIERILKARCHFDMNEFRISREGADYPLLIIKVNGDLAWLYYIPSPEHPGFHSMGTVGSDPYGATKFVTLGPQEEQYPNNQLVPFFAAVEATKQFFATPELPKCVKWFELE